ncbi:MGMT family protein [Xenorhabdus sp. 12]|uniref:MGMT family protein n=1 Tax=Xenorhabdus santafensis TaxID=2582833 RepID=A0ABU4SDF5_9GAMM|nr:MGMT family protein [Xenorhabdus sp. 12]MDX7988785.1 MGMT family protein [Xenorhabdus sp. 12]
MELAALKIKKFQEGQRRRYDQAHMIWLILIGHASYKKGKTMSYGDLAERLGYSRQAGRTLGGALGLVSLYCIKNNLPPLSAIVVDATTGYPAWGGLFRKGFTLEEEQKNIWDTDWYVFKAPSTGLFKKANQLFDWDDRSPI